MKVYSGWLVWDEDKILQQKNDMLVLVESQPNGTDNWKELKYLTVFSLKI